MSIPHLNSILSEWGVQDARFALDSRGMYLLFDRTKFKIARRFDIRVDVFARTNGLFYTVNVFRFAESFRAAPGHVCKQMEPLEERVINTPSEQEVVRKIIRVLRAISV